MKFHASRDKESGALDSARRFGCNNIHGFCDLLMRRHAKYPRPFFSTRAQPCHPYLDISDKLPPDRHREGACFDRTCAPTGLPPTSADFPGLLTRHQTAAIGAPNSPDSRLSCLPARPETRPGTAPGCDTVNVSAEALEGGFGRLEGGQLPWCPPQNCRRATRRDARCG